MMKISTDAQAKFDSRRRSFLKLSGLLGLGVATASLLPVEQAEAVLFGSKEYKVSRTRLAMGTYVSITAIHSSRDEAENAIGLAFEEMDRLSAVLSRYDSSSPVSALNTSGILQDAPREVVEMVARSIYYNRQTNGAFDITVKPLVDLYKSSFKGGGKPTDSEVEAVLQRVGAEHLRLEGGNIRFMQEGMGITLDGIAKGYIVDRAAELLAAKGIDNHLINAGGDIRTSGAAAKGKPWTVAIQDPAKQKQYPDVIRMTSGAIATSGNYEIFYDREMVFHHIVDGRTGLSPEIAASVTIKADTVMDADALSTSVFVMQPTAGIRFINGQPGCECLVVGNNGLVARSNGWQA
ncbi:MAG: FAD:protein FMN transferase [Thermodesulfobacteriota bacterium]